jgi:hypothetical protein
MSDELDTLKTQIETLTAKVAELEAKAKPPDPPKPFVRGPVGPTTTELAMCRMGMSPQAMAEMVRAVPDALMRDIARDGRRTSTLSALGGEPPAKPRGSGWRDAAPLTNPSGVAQADRLMDEQDRRDRVELAQRLARQKVAEKKEG